MQNTFTPYNLLSLAGGLPIGTAAEQAAQTYIEMYAKTSDVWQVLPWETIQGDSKAFKIEESLPEFDIWRRYNQVPDSDFGTFTTEVETIKLSQINDMTFDRALHNKPNAVQEHLSQLSLLHKAFGAKMLYNFIEGSRHRPEEPNGLKVRLGAPTNIHTIGDFGDRHFANNYDPASGSYIPGGSGLSMATVRQAIDSVNMSLGQPYWLMNRRVKSLLSSKRNDPNMDYTTDGQTIESPVGIDKLCGIPILTGYGLGMDDPFLPFTEEPEGGNGASMMPETTSIYLVVMGINGVRGIRYAPPQSWVSGAQFDEHFVWERQGFSDNAGYVVPKYAAVRISGINFSEVTK